MARARRRRVGEEPNGKKKKKGEGWKTALKWVGLTALAGVIGWKAAQAWKRNVEPESGPKALPFFNPFSDAPMPSTTVNVFGMGPVAAAPLPRNPEPPLKPAGPPKFDVDAFLAEEP